MMSDKAFYNRRAEVRQASTTSASDVPPEKDFAFELASSNVRFGAGATAELGADVRDWGARRVGLLTDARLARLPPVHTALASLRRHGLQVEMFDQCRVEPTDASFLAAIRWASAGRFDAFVAVGGGSVMDTAKAANLYSCYPADLLEYVNPPIGRGKAPPGPLKPLLAVPTTAGTGSETTGVAIFDYEALHAKTGIAHRRLRPTLGIVDPLNTRSLPPAVAAASGFDVLCHALESYTALPFDQRPYPGGPLARPAYQGANPISDVWSLHALELCARHFVHAVEHPEDDQARAGMMLAATAAGIGFGNAGVHLCHGMSYPVAGQVKSWRPSEGFDSAHPLVPHGISVVLHAPAVFQWTASTNPERHRRVLSLVRQAAHLTDGPVETARLGDALADALRALMRRLRVPDGLRALGYGPADVPALVAATLPQHRVLKLAPAPVDGPLLAELFTRSMTIY